MWLQKSEVESFDVIDTLKYIFPAAIASFPLGHIEIIFPCAVSKYMIDEIILFSKAAKNDLVKIERYR